MTLFPRLTAQRPRLHVFGALALLSLTSCPGKPAPQNEGPDRTQLLTAFADCALSSSAEFETAAVALHTQTQAWVANPGAQSLQSAQVAFHEAMDAWQVLEVVRFGPASGITIAGGQDLRDQIYSWPLVSRCSVEEELVAKGYEREDFGALLINRRGLAALEYLLFYEGADTACAATSPIVANGSWASLPADEHQRRKRAYAARITGDLVARASALRTAWEPAGGNFHQTLASPGGSNKTFATSQQALNAVSDAMFYIEAEVKDMKLAGPLGLRDCGPNVCPELLESRFAHRSRRNIERNQEGVRRLMFGCGANREGQGFHDLLVSSSAQHTAQRLLDADEKFAAALAQLAPLELNEALTADTAKVRAVHDALKLSTDLLKTEFSTVLDLELPMSVEGDND